VGSAPLRVTDVVEDEFCPKFTYFGHVLGLPQHEGRRGTVQVGRAHHARHEGQNRGFVPASLRPSPQGTPTPARNRRGGFVPSSLAWADPSAQARPARAPKAATMTAAPRKVVGLLLHSERLGLVGKIDEAVIVGGEATLIERKHSDHTRVTGTRRVQAGLLAMLMEESLGVAVRRARFIFTKENRVTVDIDVDGGVRRAALRALERAQETIRTGLMPDSRYDARCENCCYRRICPVGSLYSTSLPAAPPVGGL